jgi:hypothetical protein
MRLCKSSSCFTDSLDMQSLCQKRQRIANANISSLQALHQRTCGRNYGPHLWSYGPHLWSDRSHLYADGPYLSCHSVHIAPTLYLIKPDLLESPISTAWMPDETPLTAFRASQLSERLLHAHRNPPAHIKGASVLDDGNCQFTPGSPYCPLSMAPNPYPLEGTHMNPRTAFALSDLQSIKLKQ